MRVFALCSVVLMCLIGFMPQADAAKSSKKKVVKQTETCLKGDTSKIGFYVPCTRPGMVDRYDLAGQHGNKPWLNKPLTKEETKALRRVSEPTGVVPRLPAKP